MKIERIIAALTFSIGVILLGFFALGEWVASGDLHAVGSATTFTDIGAGLVGVVYSSAVWGDYDNDGDLDILLAGQVSGSSADVSRVYRNDGGNFTDINAGFTVLYPDAVAWGDYDNDADLDVLITGSDASKVYRNDGGHFTDINADLVSVFVGSAGWGDYDNDDDLDILITGRGGEDDQIARVYRNDNGSFVDINAGLAAVRYSAADWGDYDNDGDLDIVLMGRHGSGEYEHISRVYRNDNGYFNDINAELAGAAFGSVAWGDYDNDNDLDLLLSGRVYRNDDGNFIDINAGFPTLYRNSGAWGDCDNDGDLDILLTGSTDDNLLSVVYRNDNGSFTDIGAGLIGVYAGATAWGDYDNDGDLDILLTGYSSEKGAVSKVYRNEGTTFPFLSLSKQATPDHELRNNDTLTYTLTLSGPGLSVQLWDPLPANVQYVAGSITPPATYSSTARAIVWQGVLPSDTVQVFHFQVTPGITGTGSLSLSPPIVNTAWLTDVENYRSVSTAVIVNGRHVYLPLIVSGR